MPLFRLSILLVLFGSSLNLFAQDGFRMVNNFSNRSRNFKFGRKVIFEVKDQRRMPSNCGPSLNPDKGVYEMVVTAYENQVFTFNDSIQVPYSNMQKMFIKTPARTVKIIIAYAFLGGMVPIFYYDIGVGLGFSIFMAPVGILMLHSANRETFDCSKYYPERMNHYWD